MQRIFTFIALGLFLSLLVVINNTAFAMNCDEIHGEDNIGQHRDWKIQKLHFSWRPWSPYQNSTGINKRLSGLDIDLLNLIIKKLNIPSTYSKLEWVNNCKQLQNGKLDITLGATHINPRNKFAHFSIPYRMEENSLFISKQNTKLINVQNIEEMLEQIRGRHFKLGVIKGAIYSDSSINLFITDPNNSDIIVASESDTESMSKVLSGEIDGFIADRISGCEVMLKNNKFHPMQEIRLFIMEPIHIMFSKKTVPKSMVHRFDHEINNILKSRIYKQIIQKYLCPIIFLQTLSTDWFYYMCILGVISFSISAIAIAAQNSSTIFQAFLWAVLPSAVGCIARDIVVHKEDFIHLSPYAVYIIFTILLGWICIRFLQLYNKNYSQDLKLKRFVDHVIIFSDALGQSIFMVIAVCLVVILQIEPIELWAPLSFLLIPYMGIMIRNLLIKKYSIHEIFSDSLDAEIYMFWAFIFAINIGISVSTNHATKVLDLDATIVLIVIGALSSRLVAYYLNISNIYVSFHKIKTKKNSKQNK